jgi:transcription elongation factor Elf1
MPTIDSVQLDFECPYCRKKFSQTVRRLKSQPEFACTGCGSALAVDVDQFVRTLKKISRVGAEIPRSIKIEIGKG